MTVSSKVIAGCFALSAFIVAILSGIAADNPGAQIIVRALIAMMLCYPIGLIVGSMCARVIALHVEQYRSKTIPTARDSAAVDASRKDQEEEEPIVV